MKWNEEEEEGERERVDHTGWKRPAVCVKRGRRGQSVSRRVRGWPSLGCPSTAVRALPNTRRARAHQPKSCWGKRSEGRRWIQIQTTTTGHDSVADKPAASAPPNALPTKNTTPSPRRRLAGPTGSSAVVWITRCPASSPIMLARIQSKQAGGTIAQLTAPFRSARKFREAVPSNTLLCFFLYDTHAQGSRPKPGWLDLQKAQQPGIHSIPGLRSRRYALRPFLGKLRRACPLERLARAPPGPPPRSKPWALHSGIMRVGHGKLWWSSSSSSSSVCLYANWIK